jgi:hypothetical protein
MKFSTREDIEVPIDHAFAEMSDFNGFQRRALRHGASITRLDEGPVKVGSNWDIVFTYRGRERRLHAELTEFEAPHHYVVISTSEGMTVTTEVELVALSRGRTRIAMGMDLRAKSLTARLLLQSMKLAKGKLTKRFKARVLEHTEDIEDAYRKNV